MRVELVGGRRSSFEVTFGDEVLHSKLATEAWPDTDALLAELERRLPA